MQKTIGEWFASDLKTRLKSRGRALSTSGCAANRQSAGVDKRTICYLADYSSSHPAMTAVSPPTFPPAPFSMHGSSTSSTIVYAQQIEQGKHARRQPPHLPRMHLVTFNHANWSPSICVHHAKLARRHKQRPQQHVRGSYSHVWRPSCYEPSAMHVEHPPPATRRTAHLQRRPIILCSHGTTMAPLMARS